uniref:E3 ubiquitin-protein ligase TRIM21-like isoform X2 n=1 Tax=Centroberyx gerrardi TaxID=166262 RepID=UPI003AAB78CB
MASAGTPLSEEQLLCSVCLDIFTEPVSIQCGHTFCKTCITEYWDSSVLCQCPLCKKILYNRPDIFVNVVLLEMANRFRKSDQKRTTSPPAQRSAKLGEVSCDVCTDMKDKALKSCLVCLTSYCETHLEPHERVAGLKKHKLIDPVHNIEDWVCKKHERPLELFCRTDQTCLCQFCTEAEHKTHDTVPLEDECNERKDQMRKKEEEVQQMIKEREQKVREIKQSVELSNNEAMREMADSIEIFTALVASIQRSQAEFIEFIDEKQKATEKQAEGFIRELEQEITVLRKRGAELEQFSSTDDHLYLLQSFPYRFTPPPNKDWSGTSVRSYQSVGTLQKAVAEVGKTLSQEMAKLCDELKRIQQYGVDVTLDPDTAHPKLVLSEEGKQVYHGYVENNLPDNPERFSNCGSVLGKQSFSSGRFYYEVQVKGKTAWTLGVAIESVSRKGPITVKPENGYWTISLRNQQYSANNIPVVILSLKQTPKKVGVFVDYKEGVVSFYDTAARVPVYSFHGCTFTEKLYPYFCPCHNENGRNSDPLIICPVNNKE